MRLKVDAKVVHLVDLLLHNELDAEATDQPVLLQPLLKVLVVLKDLVIHDDLLVLSMLLHQFYVLLLHYLVDVLERTLLIGVPGP